MIFNKTHAINKLTDELDNLKGKLDRSAEREADRDPVIRQRHIQAVREGSDLVVYTSVPRYVGHFRHFDDELAAILAFAQFAEPIDLLIRILYHGTNYGTPFAGPQDLQDAAASFNLDDCDGWQAGTSEEFKQDERKSITRPPWPKDETIVVDIT